jgi:hypothetical protein
MLSFRKFVSHDWDTQNSIDVRLVFVSRSDFCHLSHHCSHVGRSHPRAHYWNPLSPMAGSYRTAPSIGAGVGREMNRAEVLSVFGDSLAVHR